jgi:hypothetical protein
MEDILTMLRHARRQLDAAYRSLPQHSRTLTWAGLLFLASGLFHAGVWLIAGLPSLEGPVSWRKPMTFGFSTGVLFLSLAWVLSLVRPTDRLRRQVQLFTALLIAEVGLIDMQQWRGVASHFNNATAFDGAVFTTMGILIVSASAIIVMWTREVFRQRLSTSVAMTWAARAGMVMLNVGNLVGLLIAVTQATQFKPLHGVTLHVIQALPVALWVLSRLRYPRAWRAALQGSH